MECQGADDERPEEPGVEERVDGEAGPEGAEDQHRNEAAPPEFLNGDRCVIGNVSFRGTSGHSGSQSSIDS